MNESEYMKEARKLVYRVEREAMKFASPHFEGDDTKLDQASAALLSHIAKGEQARAVGGEKLWLWKNFVGGRPEYWAFDNPYPVNLTDDDPQTLGEPCGYALFKPSRTGRTDVSEEQVLRAIDRAAAPLAVEGDGEVGHE